MQRKQPISLEMMELTGHSRTDVSKKKKKKTFTIWLKSTSGLYWMMAEGVLEYAVVSGLVILEQSCQGSSNSGLLGVPLCSCLVSHIDLCCKLLNVM